MKSFVIGSLGILALAIGTAIYLQQDTSSTPPWQPPEAAHKLDYSRLSSLVRNTSGLHASIQDAALVIFFTPSSHSFEMAFPELVKLSLIAPELPCEVVLVDVLKDPYTQFRYAPEMVSAWQDQTESWESFKFGHKDFYPTIAKFFRHGQEVEEFTEGMEAEAMRVYVHQHMSEIALVQSISEITKTPSLVGCFNACPQQKELFLGVGGLGLLLRLNLIP